MAESAVNIGKNQFFFIFDFVTPNYDVIWNKVVFSYYLTGINFIDFLSIIFTDYICEGSSQLL